MFASKSHCGNETCEMVSLSLAHNTKENFPLVDYIFQTFSFANWKDCFESCLVNCQCLSLNFNEVNATENCELNDANTKLAPEALKEKEGVKYFEPVRQYHDQNVRIFLFVFKLKLCMEIKIQLTLCPKTGTCLWRGRSWPSDPAFRIESTDRNLWICFRSNDFGDENN